MGHWGCHGYYIQPVPVVIACGLLTTFGIMMAMCFMVLTLVLNLSLRS